MNRHLWFATFVAALGGLLFGFDTAVINGTTDQLRSVFALGEGGLGFTVASALIGTIFGAMFIAKPTDRFGRRTILIAMGAFYFVSALGSALAWNWEAFMVFRLIGGIGVGGASVVAPMYIAEISPARNRGKLVAVFQFNIVFGILLAFLSNYAVSLVDFGDADWRWMFGMECLPAAAFFLLLFATSRSPRWLVAQNRLGEARRALGLMGTDTGSVEKEIELIQAALSEEGEHKSERLFQRKYLKPLSMAAAIAIFNQLSGINAVMYYSGDIFQQAGLDKSDALMQTILVGGINFIVTILAMALIDRFGRKKLMLAGCAGYIASLFTMAAVFYAKEGSLPVLGGIFLDGADFSSAAKTTLLVSMLFFVASHAFGMGAVIWVYLSEIFPNRIRARGQAFGSLCLWISCAAVSWGFPSMVERLSPGAPFLIFGMFMTALLFWIIFVMIETKNVPLEEIHEKLGIR